MSVHSNNREEEESGWRSWQGGGGPGEGPNPDPTEGASLSEGDSSTTKKLYVQDSNGFLLPLRLSDPQGTEWQSENAGTDSDIAGLSLPCQYNRQTGEVFYAPDCMGQYPSIRHTAMGKAASIDNPAISAGKNGDLAMDPQHPPVLRRRRSHQQKETMWAG